MSRAESPGTVHHNPGTCHLSSEIEEQALSQIVLEINDLVDEAIARELTRGAFEACILCQHSCRPLYRSAQASVLAICSSCALKCLLLARLGQRPATEHEEAYACNWCMSNDWEWMARLHNDGPDICDACCRKAAKL